MHTKSYLRISDSALNFKIASVKEFSKCYKMYSHLIREQIENFYQDQKLEILESFRKISLDIKIEEILRSLFLVNFLSINLSLAF